MKKLLVLMLILAICASFAACAANAAAEATTEATTAPTETTGEPFDWGPIINDTGSGCAMEDSDARE